MGVQVAVKDLVERILFTVPDGSTVYAVHVKSAPRVQRRVAGAERSELLIGEAREIRERDGTPFWHALFLAGESHPDGVPIDILRSALYHQDPNQAEITSLVVGPNTAEKIAALAETTEAGSSIALMSRVVLATGEERFIPMLDFSSKSSRPGSERTVRRSIEALQARGLLLSSARSYHFYGHDLVTKDEQTEFWSRALLLTPIVDERWIAHQLRAGVAALRVSQNGHGIVPTVLADDADPSLPDF